MNPIAWFESIMARMEDHINITNSIHDFINEIKDERNTLMAKFDKLEAAVADLESKVAAFVVPVAEDDTAEVDALTDRVTKATSNLEDKVTAPKADGQS